MQGVYRQSDRVFRPWKNGGGQTAEILTFPTGAGFDDFDWRLSTAIVASDGPFSSFAGVDRVLTLLEGGPMVLALPDRVERIDTRSNPVAFSGEAQCSARLEGEEVLDFNVMTRRPLQAAVLRGRFAGMATALASYALLLADHGGLRRLDLVDWVGADAATRAAVMGAPTLTVHITRPGDS